MNWEFDWLYAMQQIHNPVLDPIMVGLSALGNAGILWIIISVICLIKRDAKMWCTDDHFHACRTGDRKRNLKEPRLQTASLLDRFDRNTACQESE